MVNGKYMASACMSSLFSFFFMPFFDHDKLLIVSLIILFIYIFSLCNYRLIIVIETIFNAFPLVA